MVLRRKRARSINLRKGVAAVEAALLLPVLVVLTFSSLELSNMIFLKQGLAIASYEGSKSAAAPGATEETAKQRIEEILKSRNITDATISITPSVDQDTDRGVMVTVTISSAGNSVGILRTRMFTRGSILARSTMVRQ